MSGVKNLKVVAAGLCLGVTLLTTSCGNENTNLIEFGNSTINYETEIPTGKISYNDLNNYVKVIVFEHENISYNRIIIKDKVTYSGGLRSTSPSYDRIKYIDLKSGIPIIDYYDQSEIVWIVGEDLKIREEKSITSYLLQEDFIKKEYTLDEVMTFYDEKIKTTLENNEKELVK